MMDMESRVAVLESLIEVVKEDISEEREANKAYRHRYNEELNKLVLSVSHLNNRVENLAWKVGGIIGLITFAAKYGVDKLL